MSKLEKKFAKFFNKERKLTLKMSDSKLEERIKELESMGLEVRARLTCVLNEKVIRRKRNKS